MRGDSTLHHGDCVGVMQAMEPSSVDAVVTDPPYGLEFMGKEWDRLWRDYDNENDQEYRIEGRSAAKFQTRRPSFGADGRRMQEWHEAWAREALRVLKPGGHLLAFGGTRTFHRLACALEDAGFEIRDCLSWMYGSGFPKSLDVGNAIDRMAGAEREVVGQAITGAAYTRSDRRNADEGFESGEVLRDVTVPATPDAERWDGWGTALKPAWEPIIVARKPLAGTVAGNVLAWGTGALNIDATRIGTNDDTARHTNHSMRGGRFERHLPSERIESGGNGAGRWPANVLLTHHDECVEVGTRRVKSAGWRDTDAATDVAGPSFSARKTAGTGNHYADVDGLETVVAWDCHPSCPVRILDQQSGERPSAGKYKNPDELKNVGERGADWSTHIFQAEANKQRDNSYAGETGGASRFFYTAKSSRAERNAGLDGLPEQVKPLHIQQSAGRQMAGKAESFPTRNVHPTVKPVAVMRWLCRLVTPPNGIVLDPFLGSGTTGIAAALEGFQFIGIEREAEYLEIAKRRISYWTKHGEAALAEVRRQEQAERVREAVAESGQLDLLGS